MTEERQAPEHHMRRRLSDGRLMEGQALLTYCAKRSGPRHYDTGSRALVIAKTMPGYGARYVGHFAESLVETVPEDTTCLAVPPPSRKRLAAGWYFAGALAEAVADRLDLPLVALLWLKEGAEKASHIASHRGHGRKLGRVAAVHDPEQVRGQRVCVVDDLWTTGATCAVCAEALYAAGAEAATVRTLYMAEPTAAKPKEEQARLKWRAAIRRSREEALSGSARTASVGVRRPPVKESTP